MFSFVGSVALADLIIPPGATTVLGPTSATDGNIAVFDGTSGKLIKDGGAAPTGDVTKVGTPADSQIGVWTGDGTIEGASSLTYDGSNFGLTGDIGITGTRITKGWFAYLQTTNAPIVDSLTASEILATGSSKELVSLAVATYPSLTELSYVKGVSSAIQSQLGGKQATISFGTGVETALGVNIGSAGAPVLFDGALGTPSGGTLTNATGLPAAGVVNTAATLTDTQTLTNKRITKRVVTTTDDATAVIDIDVTDVYELSAVANATVFTLTGTPTDGQNLIVRFVDAGAAKGLTWTGFTAIGITLPTTTTQDKHEYVGCTYNLAATAWHCIANALEA